MLNPLQKAKGIELLEREVQAWQGQIANESQKVEVSSIHLTGNLSPLILTKSPSHTKMTANAHLTIKLEGDHKL